MSEWDEKFWDELFQKAKKDGGLLISKVGPPNGADCDHKESVWEFHQSVIRRCIKKHNFYVLYESRNLVSLGYMNI